jgi:hypothetical protein
VEKCGFPYLRGIPFSFRSIIFHQRIHATFNSLTLINAIIMKVLVSNGLDIWMRSWKVIATAELQLLHDKIHQRDSETSEGGCESVIEIIDKVIKRKELKHTSS